MRALCWYLGYMLVGFILAVLVMRYAPDDGLGKLAAWIAAACWTYPWHWIYTHKIKPTLMRRFS